MGSFRGFKWRNSCLDVFGRLVGRGIYLDVELEVWGRRAERFLCLFK